MGNTYITQGNMIGLNSESNNKDISKLKKDLSDVFSGNKETPKEAKKDEPTLVSSNVRNLNDDIKDTKWESVKLPVKASDETPIKPSRCDGENNYGGKSTLANALNTIFDPDKMGSQKNTEFTNHTILSGKIKKKNSEEKHERSRDWETPSKALSTNDVDANKMGFTPNKTAFKPAELPQVKIKQVEDILAAKKKNTEAGAKAAELKKELDFFLNKENEFKMKDNRRWEDIESEKIAKIHTKEMNIRPENISLAKDFVTEKKIETKQDLSEYFENSFDKISEDSIKKNIKKSMLNRKKREDDRSWEKPSTPKKTW